MQAKSRIGATPSPGRRIGITEESGKPNQTLLPRHGHRNGPAISRQFSGSLYSRSSSGNLQLPQSKQRGRLCSAQSVFAFVTGIILTIMFLRSPAFHHGYEGSSAAPSVNIHSRPSPRTQILTSLLGSQNRDLASSTIHPEANSGVNFHTSIHRKELIKPKQDPHPKTGSTGASSSASSSQSDLHAKQAILSQEAKGAGIDIEISEATAQQIQAILDETLEKPMQESVEGEGSEEEEVPEEETTVLNREKTEAAAIQGLRDALKSTDKEASVDIKLETESSKKTGDEKHNSEEGVEEDEEPAPEALSTGATTAQDSAILDDFINGASLQVTERNGMIVPEELETHKEEAPKEQQQGANTGAEPQGASASEGEAGVQALEQEQPNTASEIKTAVTTEDMSVEQTSDDNNGKPEGWSAELEQPKISTAVETEAQSGEITGQAAVQEG